MPWGFPSRGVTRETVTDASRLLSLESSSTQSSYPPVERLIRLIYRALAVSKSDGSRSLDVDSVQARSKFGIMKSINRLAASVLVEYSRDNHSGRRRWFRYIQ